MKTTNNTLATNVNNSVKSVSDKVNAIVGLVRTELLTNRNIVATLYDNRGDETLKEIASVLFADAENVTRKVAINAGVKRYTKLFPYAICIRYNETSIDYKCAKLEAVANGVYIPKELNAVETLEAVLYNYYNGGGSIGVENGKYYDATGNIIDTETAKQAIESEKRTRKFEREEKTEKRNTKIVAETDFYTLIAAAVNKAPNDDIKSVLEAILAK